MRNKVKAHVTTISAAADLPAPDVVPADLLGQFVITAVETALIAGGVQVGDHTTSGAVSPLPQLRF